MRNKVKRIAFVFMFILTFTATSLWSIPVYGASQVSNMQQGVTEYNLSDEEVERIYEEEFSGLTTGGKERGLLSALAIIALKMLIKKYGPAVAKVVAIKIGQYGFKTACKYWNDTNRAWDFVCDFEGTYYD